MIKDVSVDLSVCSFSLEQLSRNDGELFPALRQVSQRVINFKVFFSFGEERGLF